jgi:hypothetical protein
MSEYQITSDKTELPRGSYVHVIPAPVNPGDLVLSLPGLILELGESLSYRVIGPIAPIDPESAYNCLN